MEAEWRFSCSKLPENALYMATIGNGHIATVAYRDRLFLNGLYNGKGKQSHRAMIPCMGSFQISKNSEEVSSEWTLDCKKGVFVHRQSMPTYDVCHQMYAHRSMSVLVNTVTISRKSGDNSEMITVGLQTKAKLESKDLILSVVPFKDSRSGTYAQLVKGRITEPEYEKGVVFDEVYFQYDIIPDSITLPENEDTITYCFLMAVTCNLGDCESVFSNAWTMYEVGGFEQLHYQEWAKIWQSGCIEVSGNLELSKRLYGTLYYLYSSLPTPRFYPHWENEYFGISPESLSYGDMSEEDYLGHVFWDQETWMYPPMLLLQPDLAKRMLNARCRVMEQYKSNATAEGFQGMKCPWEQGATGIPTSPSDDCEKYELHVNADIALAIRNYIYATSDRSDIHLKLAHGIADFWKSRVVPNIERNLYDLNDVMPPDEFNYPVNNSAFTNMAVQLTLDSSDELRGMSAVPRLYIPFDEKLKYHPEYDGYTIGTRVKQADVVLINYPLNAEPDQEVLRNDLEIYEKATTNNGPAMTWSIFCINHLQIGQTVQAEEMFNRQFKHVQEPFKIWSEYPSGDGAINFITGMGGFLQSVLNGYGGIRMNKDSLSADMRLLPGTTCFTITGLSYLGAKLTVTLTEITISLTLTTTYSANEICVSWSGQLHKLLLNEPFSLPAGPFKLVKADDRTDCSII